LPAVIEIKNIHSHTTDSAAALSYLPASADCRNAFHQYFSNGMTVAEAMKYHTSLLELSDDVSETKLADGSLNPKQPTVHWWYNQWRNTNLGPRTGSSVLKVFN